MPVWKCSECGYTIDKDVPPTECPSCKKKCEFIDVSCYIPECGGSDSKNIDQQVFSGRVKK